MNNDSADFAKRLSGSDRRCSEWTDSWQSSSKTASRWLIS